MHVHTCMNMRVRACNPSTKQAFGQGDVQQLAIGEWLKAKLPQGYRSRTAAMTVWKILSRCDVWTAVSGRTCYSSALPLALMFAVSFLTSFLCASKTQQPDRVHLQHTDQSQSNLGNSTPQLNAFWRRVFRPTHWNVVCLRRFTLWSSKTKFCRHGERSVGA